MRIRRTVSNVVEQGRRHGDLVVRGLLGVALFVVGALLAVATQLQPRSRLERMRKVRVLGASHL
jgi:cell division septal protein FtsQ